MNSSGVRTPRERKAVDLSVGVTHSRADLRLERRDGMVGHALWLGRKGEELGRAKKLRSTKLRLMS